MLRALDVSRTPVAATHIQLYGVDPRLLRTQPGRAAPTLVVCAGTQLGTVSGPARLVRRAAAKAAEAPCRGQGTAGRRCQRRLFGSTMPGHAMSCFVCWPPWLLPSSAASERVERAIIHMTDGPCLPFRGTRSTMDNIVPGIQMF